MINSDRVAAVVVTFNRLKLLQECVQALKEQSYKLAAIIVVNNSSTDGSEEWLLQQKDIITITQPNLGGAYGFYTGIKTAFEKGYEWIWCMDDDGEPALDALEKLMMFSHESPCVMNALVLDKDDPERIVFSVNGYTRITDIHEPKLNNAAAFFNGTLIHREIIKKVGLPMKDLTIWGDETEFYNRILFRFGFPIFSVRDSIHRHPAQYSVFYKREWDVRNDWKVFFYIRNKSFVYDSRYQSKWRSWFAYLTFLAGFAGTIIVYQKRNKLKKFQLLFRGARDGYRKNTAKTIADVKQMLAKE